MKKVCGCGVKSVPGLVSGVALCQKHFNALIHEQGTEQDKKDARVYLNMSKSKRS